MPFFKTRNKATPIHPKPAAINKKGRKEKLFLSSADSEASSPTVLSSNPKTILCGAAVSSEVACPEVVPRGVDVGLDVGLLVGVGVGVFVGVGVGVAVDAVVGDGVGEGVGVGVGVEVGVGVGLGFGDPFVQAKLFCHSDELSGTLPALLSKAGIPTIPPEP